MHIEKCRKCGKNLDIAKKCTICTKPIQFHCNNCNFTTSEQIHLDCKPSKVLDKITK